MGGYVQELLWCMLVGGYGGRLRGRVCQEWLWWV